MTTSNYEDQKLIIIVRLEKLIKKYCRCPKKQQLITEMLDLYISNELDFVSNILYVHLHGHYSHRLLKKFFNELGYRINPISGDYQNFHAWRYR